MGGRREKKSQPHFQENKNHSDKVEISEIQKQSF